MNDLILYLVIALLVIALALLVLNIVLLFKKTSINYEPILKEIKQNNETTTTQLKEIENSIMNVINLFSSSTNENLKNIMLSQNQSLTNFSGEISKLTSTTNERLERMVLAIANELEKISKNNEKKLNEIRETVDEKLNSTLEKRLNDSFNLISERLQAVYTGLGEMKSLAVGVGELKNVLTNVKNRGVMGEISLNNILSELMTTNQYAENYPIKPNSQQRVDFAIFIPDKNGGKDLILPIDSKFPIESYLRLCDAYDTLNQEQIALYAKELENAVKKSAKSISEKYINVPLTTDFAVMYLPIEGLYSEVVRRTGLIEELQRNYKILITGPNTLSAFINSLQLGFKTLTIEKRSNEIWNILVSFKKEFTNFSELLARSQKQINTVSLTLESATKRTNIIEKQLQKVDSVELPNEEKINLDFELKEEN